MGQVELAEHEADPFSIGVNWLNSSRGQQTCLNMPDARTKVSMATHS